MFSKWLSTQIVLPVAALRAKTELDVSPYTVPSVIATPSGPGPLASGTSTWYSHFSLPVASASAYTLASWSCRYTTPSCTTGAAVSEPTETPAAALPVSLNAQASRSCDTFADEIAEPGASLVLARSPFGYGHDPVGAAAPGNTLVTGGPGLLPPDGAATMVTQTNAITGAQTLTPAYRRPVSLARIRLTASLRLVSQESLGSWPFAWL